MESEADIFPSNHSVSLISSRINFYFHHVFHAALPILEFFTSLLSLVVRLEHFKNKKFSCWVDSRSDRNPRFTGLAGVRVRDWGLGEALNSRFIEVKTGSKWT